MLIATAPSGQDVKQSFTSLAKRDDGASALSSRLGAARTRDARRASDASWSLPTAEGRRSPPGLAGESLQALSSYDDFKAQSLEAQDAKHRIARTRCLCAPRAYSL